jgi:Ca-activated chloride channel family protein
MALELFHFLRPAWLLLLLPAGLLIGSIWRRQDPMRGWKAVMAPELLEHLAVSPREHRGRLRPVFLLGASWLFGILAMAGPTWEKEATPFTEDQAALFVILKVTPDMLAQDIQPSRLIRAQQKITDLLDLLPGTSTGLIAYAGSAHLVMPLTTDPGIIGYFASELVPDVMPVPGDEPLKAVELARERLLDSGLPGSIVLITDSVDPSFSSGLAEKTSAGSPDVFILAIAAGFGVVPPPGSPPAPALDENTLKNAARAGGGSLVVVTPDDSDVKELSRRIDRSFASAPPQEGERWKDGGYYLLVMSSLLVLGFYRKGGAVAVNS